MKRFLAMLSARNKEFIRDRGALSWNILFPVIVVFGFAGAFSGSSQDIFKTAVHHSPNSSANVASPEFMNTRYVQFVEDGDLEDALTKLKRHSFDMVLDLGTSNRYWINSTAPKGYLLEKILHGSGLGAGDFQKQTVEGREIRYVDWLISGLLGMNMMFSALFGVGYTIVRYRKNGVLKRLKATPLHAFEFLTAQVASRLILIVVTSSFVYAGCTMLLHFQMLGSYLDLFIVMSLGAMCLISLGLLLASRIRSEEFAGGVLNLISWPMMFLSGVWFSLEGTHPLVRKAAQIFPLTHVIDSARAIMTEGATLGQVSLHLLILVGMTIVFLTAGSLCFKWE